MQDRPIAQLSIGVKRLDGQVVVTLAGELDVASAPVLHRCLVDLIQNQGNSRIAVHLGNVSFIDACGIGELVQAHNALRGGPLTVIAPSPRARRVLEVCGLLRLFRIVEASEPDQLSDGANGAWATDGAATNSTHS